MCVKKKGQINVNVSTFSGNKSIVIVVAVVRNGCIVLSVSLPRMACTGLRCECLWVRRSGSLLKLEMVLMSWGPMLFTTWANFGSVGENSTWETYTHAHTPIDVKQA